ncbi:MAG: butyrate kinase [Acidobacteriota bacterium]
MTHASPLQAAPRTPAEAAPRTPAEAAPPGASAVLSINPGTTSTKFGLFTRTHEIFSRTLRHGDDELERFRNRPMLDRLEYRAQLVETVLQQAGLLPGDAAARPWIATAGRGGLLPPLTCGTYLVDEAMLAELRRAPLGEHASNLGAPLALRFARAAGVNAYIVDPVTVDEWQPCARLTGSPLVERTCIGHWLNTKAVAKRYAREQGSAYAGLRLIVVHMGSGITVSAHRDGRVIDSNSIEEGPFGPDRTGSLPVRALLKLCARGGLSAAGLDRHVFGDGGLFAYLGTRDLIEAEHRIEAGDARAAAVFEAMVYQIAKETGAMAAVLAGRVDAVLLTGGMAHSARLLELLRPQIEWIAPIAVYPGEDELRALADGVFRVLDGEEEAQRLRVE